MKALRARLAEGILAFPATPFDRSGALDRTAFEHHIADLARFNPTALVPAGGAGELFSLSLDEQAETVRIAVAGAGKVPVLAGVGQGVAIAVAMAQAAEKAGAAGILLFPPYLVVPEQEGLAAYIEAVARSVGIAVIVYSRNNGVLSTDTVLRLAESCPNLVAVKDGVGDFESLVGLKLAAGDRLAVINGVPTAEIIGAQCFAVGIRSYTSAVFSFLPELATRYFEALKDGDRATVERLLAEFYLPLVRIRNRRRGYAVSLVKAGLRLTGHDAGRVRPPLVDLAPADEAELAALIARAAGLIEEAPIGAVAIR
ncbi:MAG TPA: 5-dehydro-4-deoxyglucarate dehydratase [Bauldia sp.]|nr:5-dehydro-4-deoxyglucarate dehydratase [Bauldia sp.]